MELTTEINKYFKKVTLLLEEKKLTNPPKVETFLKQVYCFIVCPRKKNKIQRILWQKLMEFDLYINAL